MPSTRTRQGFTLVELMVVVSIIAILSVSVISASGRAQYTRRGREAYQLVLRMGRRARAESTAYRRAHVVLFSLPAGTNGVVQVIRGQTGSCRQDWADLLAQDPVCGNNTSYCIEQFDLNAAPFGGSGVDVQLTEAGGQTSLALCYTPTGTVWHSPVLPSILPGPPPLPLNAFQEESLAYDALGDPITNGSLAFGGGFVFNINVLDNGGAALTPLRQLVFPLGGAPRGMR